MQCGNAYPVHTQNIIENNMLITLTLILLFILIVYLYMRQPKFGKRPSGERLNRLRNSANYRNGSFQNLSHTPPLTEGVSYYELLRETLFGDKKGIVPREEMPSVKTDLLQLDHAADVLVWFGHSSYFIQLDGKKILVDPVLSGVASPVKGAIKTFKGTDRYTPDDLPGIDYLFMTHDHWDHMDYPTLMRLKPKIKKIICGLGIAEHFEHWGFDKTIIIEKDWNEEIKLDDGFTAFTAPARHFSGRGFSRNKALWTSFVVQSQGFKLFIGGDSGYDSHFAEIGNKFGGFDLAILENGQYDRKWKYIHMLPSEVVQAAKDLHAKRVFPVHSAKFALARHAWDEPLKNVSAFSKQAGISLITPMIGEQVNLKDDQQEFKEWWEGLR